MKRSLAFLAALALSLPSGLLAEPQPPPQLQITILDGEGALNNIKQQTAREPIVQVTDENHKPVAGALVIFSFPQSGASGTFADGSLIFQSRTDAAGRVTTSRISPNQTAGHYQIQVTASSNGLTAKMAVNQTNIMPSIVPPPHLLGLKVVLIVAAVGAGVVAGIVATRSGSSGATITPGTGTVTAPAVRIPLGGRR